MELELKYITPYLPYGLKMTYCVENGENWILDHRNLNALTEFDKPILNPLSDLYNENNGHFNEIKRKYGCINISLDKEHPNMFVLNNEDVVSYHYLPYMVIRYLLKNHYDIYGLIEKGLAIDKNTL